MTILTFIKKVLTLMKNHKKKIIALFLVAITTTAGFLRIGIIAPPVSYYLWFFDNNKSDFELIIDYIKDNDSSIYVSSGNDLDDIEDDTVKAAAIKIMLLGCFDVIYGDNDSATFLCCCSVLATAGEPLSIRYTSESSIKERTEYYGNDSYSYKYTQICDYWYYVCMGAGL